MPETETLMSLSSFRCWSHSDCTDSDRPWPAYSASVSPRLCRASYVRQSVNSRSLRLFHFTGCEGLSNKSVPPGQAGNLLDWLTGGAGQWLRSRCGRAHFDGLLVLKRTIQIIMEMRIGTNTEITWRPYLCGASGLCVYHSHPGRDTTRCGPEHSYHETES